MILSVRTEGLVVQEPDDLKSYKVVVDGQENREAIIAAHSELRQVDPEHVAVAETVLKNLAGDLATDEEWLTGFARMINYARSRGWVTEAGEIVGHIE